MIPYWHKVASNWGKSVNHDASKNFSIGEVLNATSKQGGYIVRRTCSIFFFTSRLYASPLQRLLRFDSSRLYYWVERLNWYKSLARPKIQHSEPEVKSWQATRRSFKTKEHCLYSSSIMSHLTYCSTVWHYRLKFDRKTLGKLHERALRCIYTMISPPSLSLSLIVLATA